MSRHYLAVVPNQKISPGLTNFERFRILSYIHAVLHVHNWFLVSSPPVRWDSSVYSLPPGTKIGLQVNVQSGHTDIFIASELRLPYVFTIMESRLPSEFITRESFEHRVSFYKHLIKSRSQPQGGTIIHKMDWGSPQELPKCHVIHLWVTSLTLGILINSYLSVSINSRK